MTRRHPKARAAAAGWLAAGLLVGGSLLSGCGSIRLPGTGPRPTVTPDTAAAPEAPATADFAPERSSRRLPIEVMVEEVPSEDIWNVGYVLTTPVAGVELERGRNAVRHDRWGVGLREGEATWYADRRQAGRERICFSEPARAFSVGFRTFTGDLPKDYELNIAFSDGGRLLYTGHLLIRPLARCDAEAAEPVPGEPEHRFTFTTTPGRSVRLPGAAGDGTLRWTPASEDEAGAYVYFGELDPVETDVATVLLDPGLPAWMREEMAEAVPRLVERFTALTETPLPVRPLLLVAWNGEGGSGRSFSGGTFPGLLLASAEGPGWLEPSDEARRAWFHRVAHETFHLWAGETFRPDDDSEWLSEAAADHFAVDAAIAFGLRSEAEADRWLIERANDCLVRLAGRSLRAAAGGSAYDALSQVGDSCGAVALAAADGALRHADPPTDLAHLFRRLFQHAAATGSYGDAPFLGGLRELRADPDAANDVRRLIGSGQASRTDLFLQRVLGHAGVETALATPAEALADPGTLVEMTRRAVGRCWCGPGDGEEGGGGSDCDPIEVGKTVSAVEGEGVGADPLAAWKKVTEAAARRGDLTVTLDGLDTTLFCTDEIYDPTWEALLR